VSDKVYPFRLTDDEEKHLKKYWNNKFSDFMHEAFKKDISITDNNIKKNRIQIIATNVIYLCLGMMFLFYTLTITNLLAKIISFLIGIFIVGYGALNIYLDRKENKDEVYSKQGSRRRSF